MTMLSPRRGCTLLTFTVNWKPSAIRLHGATNMASLIPAPGKQIYIGCTAEPNTLAYWRGMLGSKTDKLKKLQNGQFLYYNRNKISEIEIQPFQYTAPKTEIMSKVTQTTQPSPKGTQTDYGALVKALVISTIGLVWLWIQFGGH